MNNDRRNVLIGGSLLALASTACRAQLPADAVRPEDFGAKGDGVTNDTDAFARMSEHINRRGGGTIVLRRTTYLVGKQFRTTRPGQEWAFNPGVIIELKDLGRPLVIQGNGATLKCAPGLRYGTFDPRSGNRTDRPMPNLRQDEVATPYKAMIWVSGCRAPVSISDVELDGNLAQLRLGGPYGDVGYQITCVGLYLEDNRAAELVRNVHSHHHGQDGLEISGIVGRAARSRFENVVSEYNGRQGLSVIGGRGYDFAGCKFNHTGRSAVFSPPGAGVDLEAEGGKINRDFTFTDCEFVDNAGCGMVADSGDTEGATFNRCRFVGTTAWAVWPYKPNFKFLNCSFVGASVRPYGDANPARAAQFVGCSFTDDPRQSPTRKVYLGGKPTYPIFDMSDSQNPSFTRCTFRLVGRGLLPWSTGAIYRDCVMSQASAEPGYPRGTYVGRTTIAGNVDLYATKFAGEVLVNGKRFGP